jgi:hypothetical protein
MTLIEADIDPRLEVAIPVEAAGQLDHVDDVGLVVPACRVDDVEPTLPNQLHRLAKQSRHRRIQLTDISMLIKQHLRTLPRENRERGIRRRRASPATRELKLAMAVATTAKAG